MIGNWTFGPCLIALCVRMYVCVCVGGCKLHVRATAFDIWLDMQPVVSLQGEWKDDYPIWAENCAFLLAANEAQSLLLPLSVSLFLSLSLSVTLSLFIALCFPFSLWFCRATIRFWVTRTTSMVFGLSSIIVIHEIKTVLKLVNFYMVYLLYVKQTPFSLILTLSQFLKII